MFFKNTIFLIFLVDQLFGQAAITNDILLKEEHIVILFDDVNTITLANSEDDHLQIEQTNYREYPVSLEVGRAENTVTLTSRLVPMVRPKNKTEKYCTEKTVFPSYKITIPKNKTVIINYIDGNLFSENFSGDLQLVFDSGNVRLNHLNGDITITAFQGSIVAYLKDSVYDINSSKGLVDNHLKANKSLNNHQDGTFGRPLNTFAVDAILSNIVVKPYRSE